MLHPTGILDLPTEILVDILENPTFPIDTLYALASLSRRLHFIALPIYFSRHGMPSTPNSVVITMRMNRKDLLSALQIALFIPQIDSITCIFPHPSCTSIFPILPHLRRLESHCSPFLGETCYSPAGYRGKHLSFRGRRPGVTGMDVPP
ncbi:hypothetical protein DFH09DRAFT_159014 [Mycena vulgaris]|nr:hypothetical protein DFH09DRAFT_159014 [Mycena vulgaris]